jgi:hypothetical protein
MSIAYNSCRNRHCQNVRQLPPKLGWQHIGAALLPCGISHLVFTLQNPLPMCASEQTRALQSALLRASAVTVIKIAMTQSTLVRAA